MRLKYKRKNPPNPNITNLSKTFLHKILGELLIITKAFELAKKVLRISILKRISATKYNIPVIELTIFNKIEISFEYIN